MTIVALPPGTVPPIVCPDAPRVFIYTQAESLLLDDAEALARRILTAAAEARS